MDNKSCDGHCEDCQNNIHEIQVEFREKLSNLLKDTLNKITPEMSNLLDEINIADDLISRAAVIYAQCEAPMSDAIFHLARSYEEIEAELISEEIAEHNIEVNSTNDPTNSNLN
jgi:hypothetical protein